MENYLFLQKFITDGWLSSSPTSWAVNIILAFLCGLGLFFLLLPYFQTDSSSPPCKKYRSSRKHHGEPRRRSSRTRKKNQTLKACRDCLQELEEVQSLVSLLQSHLGRLSDQGDFHQFSREAAPGQARRAEPAGAHQPCRGPVEDAAPAVAPSPPRAPLTGPAQPLASTLPIETPEEQTNLKKSLPDTVRKSFLPGNSYLASFIPAISGLGHASYPSLSFSQWWESTKSLFLPSALQHKCPQEHVSCHTREVSFWGGLMNRQIETYNPSFVNPDIQKLLEILITKRVELKIWKEKEKGGSVVKQWCPDHVSFWGTLWKFLGAKQNTTLPQPFWNMKDKPEQLASPQPFSSPKVLEDHLQWKCGQLFWGLPSLHSESLVATALVSTHSSQLQVPSVLFNGTSNYLPVLIQDQTSSQFSHIPPLLHHGIQPQPSTLTLSQPQALLAPSVPIRSPSLPAQRRTGEVSCPTSQKRTQSLISNEMRHLEWPLLPKQQEREKTLPNMEKISSKSFSQVPPKLPEDNQASRALGSVSTFQGDFIIFNLQKQQLQRKLSRDKHQGSLPYKIQLSLELVWPQDKLPGVSQAPEQHGLSRPFVFKGKSSQVTWRTRSRYPRSSHRKVQARFQLEKNFGKGLRQCLKKTPTNVSRVSARFQVKVLGIKSEKELERPLIRTLESDSGKHLSRGPDNKHLQETLNVHLHRKLGQISEGLFPVTVRRSWFVANHALPKSHPLMEIRNLAPLKDQNSCVNTSHELSFLCLHTQQRLEAHIIRFRVRQKWDLPLQAFEPIDLKLCEVQHLPFPHSSFVSGAHSKAKFYKFLGKPPQPHPEGEERTEESDPTSGSPLSVPSPICEEIQQVLGGTSPGEACQSSEISLPGQEGRPPSQISALGLINRTLQRKTIMGAKKDNLEPSLSLVMARNELKEESEGQPSPDKVETPEMKFSSQSPRAKGAMEVMEAEKAPAWKVILRPNDQTIYVDLRSSGSPSTNKSPSPPTELVAQDPKELSLKTKVSKFELQEKIESESWPEGHTTGVFPQDSPSDIIPPDFATSALVQESDTNVPPQDLHTNALLAADILTIHESSSYSQSEHASGDTPASPVPNDLQSSGSSSEGLQEPCVIKVEKLSESQSESDSTDEEEDQKSPKAEENEDRCAEPLAIRASQASRIGPPPQVRGSGQNLGSKYLMPEKGQIFPESYFRQRMKNFLQCINPNKKSKGLDVPLQKGKPASAPAQSRVPVRSRSVMDKKAVEAQTIVTAVGQILVEKLGLHQGLGASEIYQCKELQVPLQEDFCHHRVLSSDQKTVRGTASNVHATSKGRSFPNKSELTRDRNNRWESLSRELGPPHRPRQQWPLVAGVSGHDHHYPTYSLQKRVSSHQAECASHTFPGGKYFPLQEKIEYMQRKPFVSHVSTTSVC